MILKEITQKIAKDLNLPEEVVHKAYLSFWRYIKESIQILPLKENLSEEEFSKLKTNFNIPSIGKLYCIYENYSRLTDHFEKTNIKNNVKDKENFVWNKVEEPKTEGDLDSQYNKTSKDGRKYTTIPLHAKGETKNGQTGKDWNSKSHGLIKIIPGRHWAVSHEEMERLDDSSL